MTTAVQKDRIFKGMLHVSAAFFLFTLMHALNKLLTGTHHVVEIVFYRNMMALLPCLAYVLITRRYHLFSTPQPGKMATRVLVGAVSLILTFAAIQHLPLSDATVIFFASVLFVPAIAHFALRERIGWQRWCAILIGMGGVILVAQPSANVTLFGVALALGAALGQAIVHVTLRAMKRESPFTITFYFFLGGAFFPGLALPWFFHMPTPESLLILLGIGITGGLAQYFLTTGFQMGPASLLAPFNYTALLWATGLDMLIWHYVPGWPVFVGAAIIIASKLYIIYRERRKEQKTRNHRPPPPE